MPKGRTWPAEWSTCADRTTGFAVRRLTNSPPAHNIHFYFHDPAWSPDGRWFVFSSNRDGDRSNLFALRLDSGETVQLTEGGAGGGWVSRRASRAYWYAGREIRAIDLDSLDERTIGTLPEGLSPYGGPAENADGTLIVFGGTTARGRGIRAMRTADGSTFPIWETAGVPSHVHTSPVDPALIMHCDSTVSDEKPKQRVWFLTTDGARHWHPYTQTPQEWLTHESFLGTTGKALICYWPTGIIEADLDGNHRLIAKVNAWHAGASPDGKYCVVDTNWPDRGLHLVETATGRMCKLAEYDASVAGTGAHPHPSFSADGQYVVFGSERDGQPDIYTVEIAQAIDRQDRWWTPDHTWHRF